MILFKLTHQQAEQLHHILALSLQLSPEHADDALALLHHLQQAQLAAPLEQPCTVCRTLFFPAGSGRSGLYCSNACKQKAFRQRYNASKRYFGPASRP